MRLAPSSLRGRLLLGLGLGLSVLWLGLALWLHHEVRDRVAAVLDQRLAAELNVRAEDAAQAQEIAAFLDEHELNFGMRLKSGDEGQLFLVEEDEVQSVETSEE